MLDEKRKEDHMANDQVKDNYINIEEAAEYIGVSVITVHGWIRRKNDFPTHKGGKLWKFKKAELDEWVSSGKSANV